MDGIPGLALGEGKQEWFAYISTGKRLVREREWERGGGREEGGGCVCVCARARARLHTHACTHAQLLSRVWVFCNPLDYSCQFPAKNTGMGCHFLLQRIFPTQGSNSHLLSLAGRFFTTEPTGKSMIQLNQISASGKQAFENSLYCKHYFCPPNWWANKQTDHLSLWV